jgi:hypothetical protein
MWTLILGITIGIGTTTLLGQPYKLIVFIIKLILFFLVLLVSIPVWLILSYIIVAPIYIFILPFIFVFEIWLFLLIVFNRKKRSKWWSKLCYAYKKIGDSNEELKYKEFTFLVPSIWLLDSLIWIGSAVVKKLIMQYDKAFSQLDRQHPIDESQ